MQVTEKKYYFLLHFAASLGNVEIVEIVASSKNINLNIVDEETGTNAFWLAVFYGRGEVASHLATKGIDILCKHKETQSNALHISIERHHYKLAVMLI